MQVIFNFSGCCSVPTILRTQKQTENHNKISGTLPTGESSLATQQGLPGGFPAPCVWHMRLPGFENPLSKACLTGLGSQRTEAVSPLIEDRGCISLSISASSYTEAACGAGLLKESVKELMNKCHLTKLCVLTCHLYRCLEALAHLPRGGFVFMMTSTGIRPDSFRRCSK